MECDIDKKYNGYKMGTIIFWKDKPYVIIDVVNEFTDSGFEYMCFNKDFILCFFWHKDVIALSDQKNDELIKEGKLLYSAFWTNVKKNHLRFRPLYKYDVIGCSLFANKYYPIDTSRPVKPRSR